MSISAQPRSVPQWQDSPTGRSDRAGCSTGLAVSRAGPPLIATAELFSWDSVLTASNIGHVVEERLSGLCAPNLLLSLALAWPNAGRAQRPLVALECSAAFVYAACIFGVDVPTYWSRWIAHDALGRGALRVADGLRDASTRRVVSQRWADWRGEVIWMTACFSVAMWTRMALVRVPAQGQRESRMPAAPKQSPRASDSASIGGKR